MAKTRAEEIAEEDKEAEEANKKRIAKEKAEKKKREEERKKFLKNLKKDKNKNKKKVLSDSQRISRLYNEEMLDEDPQNMKPRDREGNLYRWPKGRYGVEGGYGREDSYFSIGAKSGGSIKKYAHGGSVRKTKRYDY